MIKYIVIHNTHNGCYDFQCYQDEAARIRLTSITINPPKIFMFSTRDEAQDFFEEYINDVDCIDIRCKRGDEVEHIDYCTCGVIELDDQGEPILFYNKKNQIFLMENAPQMFLPNNDLKNDINNIYYWVTHWKDNIREKIRIQKPIFNNNFNQHNLPLNKDANFLPFTKNKYNKTYNKEPSDIFDNKESVKIYMILILLIF